jgi:hypothetical protein
MNLIDGEIYLVRGTNCEDVYLVREHVINLIDEHMEFKEPVHSYKFFKQKDYNGGIAPLTRKEYLDYYLKCFETTPISSEEEKQLVSIKDKLILIGRFSDNYTYLECGISGY